MFLKPGSVLVVSFQSLTQRNAAGMAQLGYFVSEKLHRAEALDRFIIYSKGKFDTPFPSRPVSIFSRVLLLIIRLLEKYAQLSSHRSRYIQEVIYDWFCRQHLHTSIKVLFTTTAHLPRTFKKAKKMGILICYFPGNPHDERIYEILKKEQQRLGLTKPDPYTFLPRLKFFLRGIEYPDFILCASSVVRDSYQTKGLKNIKHFQTPICPVLPAVAPKVKKHQNFRVGYLAYSTCLKGLQYLLEAWQDVMKEHPAADMELHIGGSIEPELADYLKSRYRKLHGVKYLGFIPDSIHFMKNLDLFISPSLIDSGPYTLMEAAITGTPIVLSDMCGGKDALNVNDEGCHTVPAQNAQAIKKAISYYYQHPEKATDLGERGKNNIHSISLDSLIDEIIPFLEEQSIASNRKLNTQPS